jgi:hypothetical protein
MIRATPAHGQPAAGARLGAVLQLSPEISGVGDAGDDAGTLARTQALAPAVVLTGIRIPGCEPRGGWKARACFPAAQ